MGRSIIIAPILGRGRSYIIYMSVHIMITSYKTKAITTILKGLPLGKPLGVSYTLYVVHILDIWVARLHGPQYLDEEVN